MAKKRNTSIPPVSSLGDLHAKARAESPLGDAYERLALVAAENLGGDSRDIANLGNAMAWLETNAMETSEEGVIEEVNSLRDFL